VAHRTLLSTVRGQLEDERARLHAQITTLQSGEGALSYDEGFADSGQVAAGQGENRALFGQLTEQLGEVDHALAKLDDGTYGVCERCGAPISEPRLEAMPATRFCIEHA